MRTSSSPNPDTQLPQTDDAGVNSTPNSTQETTFPYLIGDLTSQNLVAGHPSTLPPGWDDAVSTLQPDATVNGQLQQEQSKCEQIGELLEQPGLEEFSFSSGDVIRSHKNSLAQIKLLQTSSPATYHNENFASMTRVSPKI